jgi:hypothetical protein
MGDAKSRLQNADLSVSRQAPRARVAPGAGKRRARADKEPGDAKGTDHRSTVTNRQTSSQKRRAPSARKNLEKERLLSPVALFEVPLTQHPAQHNRETLQSGVLTHSLLVHTPKKRRLVPYIYHDNGGCSLLLLLLRAEARGDDPRP